MVEYSGLPFIIKDNNNRIIRGLIKLHKDTLMLEFQEYKYVYRGGVMYEEKPSDIIEVNLPLREIDSISLIKGWFRTHLTIRANKLTTLQNVPGSKQAKAKLRIEREDRAVAEQFTSKLELKITECKLDSLDNMGELI